jgi:selenide,water dikinase
VDPRVLVGTGTHDDAGVYLLDNGTALVQTVDYFTPIVDDPYEFGAIAAVNALSDVYAMGGRPLTALNIAGFPSGLLPPSVLGTIMKGGRDVLDDAGVALIGGHTIDDAEPKMGYAITGIVDPNRIWRNSTARSGDIVYLTKPIGTGVMVKAIKDDRASPEESRAAVAAMREPNRGAAECLHRAGHPTACTDVTGFGLLGHAYQMAAASGAHFRLEGSQVPVLPGALDAARHDLFPGGSRNNRRFFEPHVAVEDHLLEERVALLYDAVTSGGLLFTLEPSASDAVEAAFREAGLSLYRIGSVTDGTPGITVF